MNHKTQWMRGGITPAAQRVIVPEAERLRNQATRLEKAIGESSADWDRRSYWPGDGWNAKGETQAFVYGPMADQIRAKAWELRKRAIVLDLCAIAKQQTAAGVVADVPQQEPEAA